MLVRLEQECQYLKEESLGINEDRFALEREVRELRDRCAEVEAEVATRDD